MPLSVLRGQRAPGDRWTTHDRSLAVALTLHEATLCGGCGHPVEEASSLDADPGNRDALWHYEVEAPHRCHACTAIEQQQAEYAEAENSRALRFTAIRVDHDEPEVPA